MLAFVLLTQSQTPATAATSPAVASTGFLQTDGQRIMDQAGNTVVLRGANFFGYEYAVGIAEKWDTHSESDYAQMASWGFNVVRLPIAWALIEPEPRKYDENYMSYVDRDIGWAKTNGLYVILDMHDNSWSPKFTYYDSWHTTGVPSWAVSQYPNSDQGEAQARADFYNNLGPNGTPVSSTNPSLQDRFVQVWEYVAGRYASEPAVAGYDLLNEPTVFSADTQVNYYNESQFVSQTLPTFYEKVAAGIRTVDTRHMIFWEPAQVPLIWDNPSEYLSLMTTGPTYVDISNAIYSPHYPGIGPGLSLQAYNGDKARLEASLESNILSLSARWNQPVFIGEWGIVSDGTNAAQYVHDLSDLLDKYLLSSAWWTYGYCSNGMCIFDDSGQERGTITGNLIRPFVQAWSAIQAIAGTLGAEELQLSLQGAGTLRVVFPTFYHLQLVQVNGQLVVLRRTTISASNILSLDLTLQTCEVTIAFHQ
jgi:aryl-phospho-beta-D-glucosidase BglC (GH1 family)